MADTEPLRKALFAEMKGRIKEDDSSVPMKDGPFSYGTSFQLGGEQPRYFRMPGERRRRRRSSSTATLRPPARPISASPASTIPPTTAACSGALTTRARNSSRSASATSPTGTDLEDRVEDTGGGGVWDAANDGFFYTLLDANHRPSKIFFHTLGTPAAGDRLVYEEADPGFFMSVGGTRAQRLDPDLDQRPRDLGIPSPAGRRSDGRAAAGRRCARPGSNTIWRKAATSSSSSPMPTAPRISRS